MTPPASSSSADQVLLIRRDVDVVSAQYAIRAFAARCGFPARIQCEICIAASEAATNMVKYAGGGELVLSRLPLLPLPTSPTTPATPPGMMFEARDRGPGIPNLTTALQDGISQDQAVILIPNAQRRGLGCGLGAIQRLMSSTEILPRPGGGTLVRAKRFL